MYQYAYFGVVFDRNQRAGFFPGSTVLELAGSSDKSFGSGVDIYRRERAVSLDPFPLLRVDI